jgi:hypothetical protein
MIGLTPGSAMRIGASRGGDALPRLAAFDDALNPPELKKVC